MNAALLGVVGTLAGVVLGFIGNSLTNRLANLRTEKDRATSLFGQVLQGLSAYQVEVDSFHDRRTSRSARTQAIG